MSDLSMHEQSSAIRPMARPSVPPATSGRLHPARVLLCGSLTLLLGLGACGKKTVSSGLESSSAKTPSTDGFSDTYVPPPPEARFLEIEEVVDRGKTLNRYKVEITNSTAFPKKWFKGAPELPAVGNHSTASRCVIEVIAPTGEVLRQFAEADRDLRMPVWFALPPGAAVPETVRVVIHDRLTKQRYQSEPIELPRPDPTDAELAANSQEEETPKPASGKPAEEASSKPDDKETPGEADYVKVNADDQGLLDMVGKFAEVTATVRESRRTKGSEHLVVSCKGKKFMLFCAGKYSTKVFGEGDPLEKLKPGTRLKVRGKITLFKNQPQIVLKSADQLLEIEAAAESLVPENSQEVGKEE